MKVAVEPEALADFCFRLGYRLRLNFIGTGMFVSADRLRKLLRQMFAYRLRGWRTNDPTFRDDGSDEFRRSHIECRVVDRGVIRSRLPSEATCDFFAGSLFNLNAAAIREIQVKRT